MARWGREEDVGMGQRVDGDAGAAAAAAADEWLVPEL